MIKNQNCLVKISTIVVLGFSGFSIACMEVRNRNVAVAASVAGFTPASGNDCQGDDSATRELRRLITLLSSSKDGGQASKELLAMASQSSAQRALVIRQLVSDVAKHDELNGQRAILSNSLEYWIRATNIFAQLKATEALDAMIKCIHCGNEMSGSLNVRPAFSALESLGPIAIPKLSEALRTHPDPYVRSQIALCIGDIGGAEARKALNRALRTERNKDVRHHIRWGLATIAGDPSRYW